MIKVLSWKLDFMLVLTTCTVRDQKYVLVARQNKLFRPAYTAIPYTGNYKVVYI